MTQQDDARADSAAGSGAPQPESDGSVTAATSAGLAGADTPPSSPDPAAQPGQQQSAPHPPTLASDRSQQAEPPRQVSYPSPYLEPGESIPHAYLAPPQPGQPRYGQQQATGYQFAPRRQPGGQPGYGQPGSAPPGDGEPAYGPPRRDLGRPGTAGRGYPRQARTARDPGLAAPWERLIASILDWIVIWAVALIAFASPLLRILHHLRSLALQYPSLSSAGQRAADNFLREPANVSTMLHIFLTLFGVALVYYWVLEATWGATLGKRALGMRVVTATDRSRIGIRAAGIRTVTFLVGPLLLLFSSPLSLVGGVVWFADTLMPLIDLRVQCLHDKLAGTVVVKRQRESQPAQRPSPW